ncbi:MAG: M48 family metalloprotease [Spirochaetaceae bacterium]|jgi:predicted Zn-dependent protease|nr:M48 family metalloprotease [Spirochaetaceae bacterium]
MKKTLLANRTSCRVFGIAALLCTVVLMLTSCQALSSAINAGAGIASATGMIPDSMGKAIVSSSTAIAGAAEQITPEQEYYIGRAVGASVLTTYSPYMNADFTAYLNRICAVLTLNSPRPDIFRGYHVQILNTSEINAFATSGGHIFVTRGLLECADSEDSLAAVLAHEVAHIQLQHSLKSIKTSRITNALAVTSVSVVGAATDTMELTTALDESVADIVKTMVNNGYSKQQEYDADAYAAGLMEASGYNPAALMRMLQLLDEKQGSKNTGFGKTHPAPQDRIKKATPYTSKYASITEGQSLRQSRFESSIKGL